MAIFFRQPPTVFLLFSSLLSQALPLSLAQSTTNSTAGNQTSLRQGQVDRLVTIIIMLLILVIYMASFIAIWTTSCNGVSDRHYLLPVTATSGSRRYGARGLDGSEIAALPTFVYSEVTELKIGKGSLECAVCLCDFEDSETLRLLPRCDHVFHPECVDPWLATRPTCPVCRLDLLAAEVTDRFAASAAAANQSDSADSNGGQLGGGSASEEEEGEFRSCECGACLQRAGYEFPVEERQRGELEAIEIEKLDQASKVGGIWRFSGSNSMGHSVVVLTRVGGYGGGEEGNYGDSDRFRLRLPGKVRRQIIERSEEQRMKRAKSCAVLPRIPSSRRGYRSSASGEGSNNSPSIRLLRWSQRWMSGRREGGGELVKVGSNSRDASAETSCGTIAVAVSVDC